MYPMVAEKSKEYVNRVLKKNRRTKGSAENKRFYVENEEIQNLAAEKVEKEVFTVQAYF
ncbi:MAG: hypothetical protein ACHQXK_01085 [Methanosarcina thermophila]|jgi:polyhydroxyalkanoate synthesis regulator phasin|uniref:Uncharacterized protein n=1 Tax=Methanosarcina thermophila TaxID=2210 RepID=A0A1I6XU06_METTE|nr:hypothetical protein [Methanosarcina thermophila]NLU56868.1 hypothetical protein [Methanosarcina thermophila]SFT41556.1 hypothetical protein SAMN02910340_00572 [Methanosarcina thermophila]BAW30587.1 conserved hypothetical protein [Methanosarcina thermophila]GLI13469.1 hypothetical protein MTHERMMSTA1_05950 [Methanosarcina thermophila MST-A1]HOA68238.1 hypothetical protein [Methanosarcina thermophila]